MVLCPGTGKAQLAVVLVLKHLRRRGYGSKSHPTDCEKKGTEPATPGLQGKFFLVAFLGINQFPQIGLRLCVGFMTGTLKGSPKVEKLGVEPAFPSLQNIGIPYTKNLFMAFLGINQFRWVSLRCVCVGLMTGTPKGSPKMVLW